MPRTSQDLSRRRRLNHRALAGSRGEASGIFLRVFDTKTALLLSEMSIELIKSHHEERDSVVEEGDIIDIEAEFDF